MRQQNVPSEFQAFVSDDGMRVRLGGRNLKVVPEWIKTLTALVTLDLQGNRLTTLPEWLMIPSDHDLYVACFYPAGLSV